MFFEVINTHKFFPTDFTFPSFSLKVIDPDMPYQVILRSIFFQTPIQVATENLRLEHFHFGNISLQDMQRKYPKMKKLGITASRNSLKPQRKLQNQQNITLNYLNPTFTYQYLLPNPRKNNQSLKEFMQTYMH